MDIYFNINKQINIIFFYWKNNIYTNKLNYVKINKEETEFYKKIGNSLAKARISKDEKQKTIAYMLGCGQSTLQKIEYGSYRISLFQFVKLCKVLEINPSELLGFEKSKYDDKLYDLITTFSSVKRNKIINLLEKLKDSLIL